MVGQDERTVVTGQGAVAVRCEGVGKRFGGTWVLQDVDVEIRRGEVVGLIGPGGHGKSVLLKLFAGLLRPDAGRVLVTGKDLATLKPIELAQVREGLGYLFQNYALFDFMTVFDNVAFPLRQQGVDEARIEALVTERLEEVGLGHALHLFPNELSGGMKKRVGLSRATISESPIIFYDDPTAGLDPVTSSKIFRLIDRMQEKVEGSATVVVSHDIDRMKVICTRYVMIYEGRVVFDGPESAIEAANPLVGEFFYGALHKAQGIV